VAHVWAYLEGLTRHPHRGTATAQEAAAAKECAGWLAAMGYRVDVEPFQTPVDTLYFGPAVVLTGFAVALGVGRYLPWAGILLCLLFLAPLVGELLGSSKLDLDWVLPRYRSQNVVAWGPSSGQPERTVVISGHYDTQRGTLLFHPRVAPYIQPYFTFAYVLLALAPVALVLRWALPAASWLNLLLAVLTGLMLANVLFLLACRFSGGGHINGANDNGTGAALTLALAKRFAGEAPNGTQFVFVLTGAEEVGTRGMKAFLRAHAFDLATTRFVNLDNLGGGQIHYLQGEGMLSVQRYGAELLGLAELMARETGGKIRPKGNLLLPTDGLIPARAGYQAITFLAFLADGSLPNYHWHTDTLDRVDRQLVEFAEQLLSEYVERVAGGTVSAGV